MAIVIASYRFGNLIGFILYQSLLLSSNLLARYLLMWKFLNLIYFWSKSQSQCWYFLHIFICRSSSNTMKTLFLKPKRIVTWLIVLILLIIFEISNLSQLILPELHVFCRIFSCVASPSLLATFDLMLLVIVVCEDIL